jgi:hypothetical protein
LKTSNILHKKFQIGIKLQYQVVVGDRKSYDHLIKLKSAKVSSPVSLKSSKLKWENLLPLMGEGSPILSSGSFSNFDDSLNELSKTDDYQLTKCFHSLIRWNIAM